MTRITRRQALKEMAVFAGSGLIVAGCDMAGTAGGGIAAAPFGSTLHATWIDPLGTGVLQPGPGEPLIARTELGAAEPLTTEIATLAHVTDAHVLDASSPARVTFLDRLGAPFESTFRPQETLTAQVLAGTLRSVSTLRPDAVIQGGDLIDNDQGNELRQALAVLRGGEVRPTTPAYTGVQLADNPDPFYYRPDVDAPRYPQMLARAARPFPSVGLRAPWYPVLGDHDILVAGEIPPTAETQALATGDQALWELPAGLQLPPGTSLTAGLSPDGPPRPQLVHQFLARALAEPKVTVPADGARRQLSASEVVASLQRATTVRGVAGRLDYHVDLGPHVRLIVLDLARREGGSGGHVDPSQPRWLASELAATGDRWVVVVSHQPLIDSSGGDVLLALLDEDPRVVAAIAGHTHHNRIEPRPTGAGGYWLITTASLIDYPQQARALRIVETAGGGVALQTWMLDHTLPGDLGRISRQLSYLDAQGGRPKGFAGGRLDRNVTLYRAAAR